MREFKFIAFGFFTEKLEEFGFSIGPYSSVPFKKINTFDYTIMQNTGLKDKNGTDIYEGDVVKYHNNKFMVTFKLGSFMLSRMSKNIDMNIFFDDCYDDYLYPLSQLYWNTNCKDDIITDLVIIRNLHYNIDKFKRNKDIKTEYFYVD